MGNCKDPKSNSYYNENRFVLIQECKSGSEFCPWPTLGTVLATAAHEIHSQLALSSVGRSSPRVTLNASYRQCLDGPRNWKVATKLLDFDRHPY